MGIRSNVDNCSIIDTILIEPVSNLLINSELTNQRLQLRGVKLPKTYNNYKKTSYNVCNDCNTIAASLRGVYDHSGHITGEHVDRYDGEHVPEDSRDQERMAAPVGQNSAGRRERRAASTAVEESVGL